MLLTFRGIPCIYYGDEVGVKGRKEDGDAGALPLVFRVWLVFCICVYSLAGVYGSMHGAVLEA